MTVVIKAKHIDEKGQLKPMKYCWILPENLKAEAGDLAFVQTTQGPQIVSVTDVGEWDDEKLERVQAKLASKVYKNDSHQLQKVLGVQPGAKK